MRSENERGAFRPGPPFGRKREADKVITANDTFGAPIWIDADHSAPAAVRGHDT